MFCKNKIKIPVIIHNKLREEQLPKCDFCGGLLEFKYSYNLKYVTGYFPHEAIDCLKEHVSELASRVHKLENKINENNRKIK